MVTQIIILNCQIQSFNWNFKVCMCARMCESASVCVCLCICECVRVCACAKVHIVHKTMFECNIFENISEFHWSYVLLLAKTFLAP